LWGLWKEIGGPTKLGGDPFVRRANFFNRHLGVGHQTIFLEAHHTGFYNKRSGVKYEGGFTRLLFYNPPGV